MVSAYGVLASALLLSSVSALPATGFTHAPKSKLQARQYVLDETCNNDKYKAKVEKAWGDVNTIVEMVTNDRDGFRASNAFKHYFGDYDYDQVMRMMDVIHDNSKPFDENDQSTYKFNVYCGDEAAEGFCKGTLAFTLAPGDTPNMFLCDLFFSGSDETKNDLDSKPLTGKRGEDYWCKDGMKFDYFYVAGLTLMHEITHLDVVGEKGGLPETTDPDSNVRSHGTFDVLYYGPQDEIRKRYYRGSIAMHTYDAARQLQSYWEQFAGDGNSYRPQIPSTANAESYAASALEYYFQKKCGWDNIIGAGDPLSGK